MREKEIYQDVSGLNIFWLNHEAPVKAEKIWEHIPWGSLITDHVCVLRQDNKDYLFHADRSDGEKGMQITVAQCADIISGKITPEQCRELVFTGQIAPEN